MTVEEFDICPPANDLPPLSSLVGSMPDLTEGEDPVAWLRAVRQYAGPADG
ncbi:MAG: hypothetical protein ACRDZS_14955 [Acidimicrobiales bacterium]